MANVFDHPLSDQELSRHRSCKCPSSPVCSGYSVRLFLEDHGATGVAFPRDLPIAVIERCTGGRVYVLATPVTLGRRQFDAFDLMRRRPARGTLPAPGYKREPDETCAARIFLPLAKTHPVAPIIFSTAEALPSSIIYAPHEHRHYRKRCS